MKRAVLDMNKFSLIFLLCCFSLSFSQSKNEREERIPSSEFPEEAHRYFNGITDKVNYLKFYRETDGDKKSYEAKFKLNKLYYSVEFSTEGVLEDIEIIIKKKHIPKPVLEQIEHYLDTNFERSRFIKIQKKYVNNTSKNDKQFIDYIIENPESINTHYEIIAETKSRNDHQLRELTFTNLGEFKKSRKVSSSSYEHALY
ncbi:hypothetical protein [Cognatitamlana onchidii]|uniref:hypothetical protein n=1 Tax=Cognatitamlana onchidii TaxID=2562860 RepID=UPI0010A5C08B|nr:hypothetical protein [Algibacter onchidii]